ncbi:hypothetical protein [Legionella waltersii]|uniref:Uncharacterized protein n=1 Tax=Legionella waltersii TaxID=66969 RepID=A0A0W1ADN6_9GAMM|nr:hypothetical protein [Legionella waltersii]KTD79437.1 hypothetical protein Lwal_1509 [Legionella waltersii]SNU97661.1 Uncharacterised protein [Legionella waltersii]
MFKRKTMKLLFIVMILAYSTTTVAMSVELVDTSPNSPAVLNNEEVLYVRIHYKSEQPLRFQAVGSSLGDSLLQHLKLNPSQAYPAGEGEAIAWVSYSKVTEIDAITVTVYDANWQALKTVSRPVSANWLATHNTVNNPVAAWAKRLNREQQGSVGRAQGSLKVLAKVNTSPGQRADTYIASRTTNAGDESSIDSSSLHNVTL